MKDETQVSSRRRKFCTAVLALLLVCASGCGGFAARRMAQAPNSYPEWLAPEAPVKLVFTEQVLRAFTNRFVKVPQPQARIRYRMIEPGDYEFAWTNRFEPDGTLAFEFSAAVDRLPERRNGWPGEPRGTAVLLHGYGVAGFAMLHWGLFLAEKGWRCVVIDLRGHGKSTGKRIYFGAREVFDLKRLLDQLENQGQIALPVTVVGDSFGAVLALRWQLEDERIDRVVAVSPYADLGRAILNIAEEYASWLPDWFLRAGIRNLPDVLRVDECELNPECWMSEVNGSGESALFIAGAEDRIAPAAEVQRLERLYQSSGGESRFLVVPGAGHEALPFYLDELAEPVLEWLEGEPRAGASPLADSEIALPKE